MRNSPNKNRGVVLITAICLAGIASILIAAITSFVFSEARRTADAQQLGQVQELLLAGRVVLEGQVEAGVDRIGAKSEVALPDSLAVHGAKLTCWIVLADIKEVQGSVVANVAGNAEAQSLVWTHRRSGWQLTAARLLPAP